MQAIGFWRQVLRDAGGELAVAATYLFAWLFCAWLPDRVLLALIAGIGLQFFFFPVLLGAIAPRGARAITLLVVGHAALAALLLWIASAGGADHPDLLAVALAQAPLVLRSVMKRWQPGQRQISMLLEATGAWFLMMPVVLVTAALIGLLPDTGLAPRELRFENYPPLPAHDVGFALMAGAVYFALYAVARTFMQRLDADEHRRDNLSPDVIRRWREQFQRSRGR